MPTAFSLKLSVDCGFDPEGRKLRTRDLFACVKERSNSDAVVNENAPRKLKAKKETAITGPV
jgi:hypothetical protein